MRNAKVSRGSNAFKKKYIFTFCLIASSNNDNAQRNIELPLDMSNIQYCSNHGHLVE